MARIDVYLESFVQDGMVAKPDAFSAFGMGPRMCPGQALAVTEMRALLKLMALDGLHIDFEDPLTKWEVQGLTSRPKNGKCTVRFDGQEALHRVAL